VKRHPLAAALLLVPAAVAALAVPAGASTPSKVAWQHWSLPCAGGHKSATLVVKWVRTGPDSTDVQKGWYDNPCSHQWLTVYWVFPDSQSNGGTFEVPPRHKGQSAENLYRGELTPTP